MNTYKVIEDGLCCFDKMEDLAVVKEQILEMVYTYTVDELPLAFDVICEQTDQLVQTHLFKLEHIATDEEPDT